MKEEAGCPYCGEWSEVICENYVAPFVEEDLNGNDVVSPIHIWSWWWKDSAACPKCNAVVLVESECEFRKVRTA